MQVARMRDRRFRERGREGVAGAVNRSFRILIGWNSEGCTGGWVFKMTPSRWRGTVELRLIERDWQRPKRGQEWRLRVRVTEHGEQTMLHVSGRRK